jgi:ATP adenylyltransferase
MYCWEGHYTRRVKQLWAPWRLEYIKSADEEDGCVFCAAVAGDDEDKLVVHRGEKTIVLLNKFPYSSGHFMAAPIRHIAEYGELDDDEVLELHRFSSAGMEALGELYGPQGYNVGWNLGRVAGAGIVDHAGPRRREGAARTSPGDEGEARGSLARLGRRSEAVLELLEATLEAREPLLDSSEAVVRFRR